MPTRSLSSSVLRWPGQNEVVGALKALAGKWKELYPDLRKVGYFGSYARGDWGVGSDLDVLCVVGEENKPALNATSLPVPADVLVYTAEELSSLEGRFRDVIDREVIWVV